MTASVPFAAANAPIALALTGGAASSVVIATAPQHGAAVATGTTIAYTPIAGYSGPDTFSYTVTGPGGTSAPAVVTITVVAPPPPTATAQQITVSTGGGKSGPVTINLAPDITNASGIVIVTPPQHGTANVVGFTVIYAVSPGYYGTDSFTYESLGLNSASLASGSRRPLASGQMVSPPATITIQIAPPTLTIAPIPVAKAQVGVPYATTVAATGGTAPYTYTIASGALPAGITLNATTGVIGGSSTAQGTFTFAIAATDSSTGSGPFTITQPFTLAVAAPTIVVTPPSFPAVQQGAALPAVSFTAAGGVAPYGFSVTNGTIPSGLVLSPAGVLSGTPTVAGAFAFTVTATDSTGGTAATGSVPVSLTIAAAAPPTIVAQNATVLAGRSVTFDTASGATGAPFTTAAIVTPPAVGTAVVSGTTITYTAPATFGGKATFTYTLANAYATSAPATATLTVNPLPFAPPPITVALAADTTGSASISAAATGGPFVSATILAVSPASAGSARLVVDSMNGVPTYAIAFTPAPGIAGPAVVTYTLSNAYASSAPGTVTFQVAARPDPSRDPDVRGLVTAQTDAAIRFAQAQLGNVDRRLQALHQGAAGQNGSYLGASIGGAANRDASLSVDPEGRALRRADARQTAQASPSAPLPALTTKTIAYWIGGNVDYGLHGQNSQRSGLRFSSDGITIGLDDALSHAFTLGAAFGFGGDNTEIGSNGAHDRATNVAGSLYGSFRPSSATYVDSVFGYSSLNFTTRRQYTAFGTFVNGSRPGNELFGSITAAREYSAHGTQFAPFLGVQGISGTLAPFTESGGIGALRYGSTAVRSLRSKLGLRASETYNIGSLRLQPGFDLEYQHEFKNSGGYALQYADLPNGQVYQGTVDGMGTDHIILGLHTQITMPFWTFGIEYTTESANGVITVHHALVKVIWHP